MSRRKVVTEITIETNQVLVIKRKQVTRIRRSECGSGAEFVQPDKVRLDMSRLNKGNVLVDETGNRQSVEAPFSTPRFTDSAVGSHSTYRRSLLGATMLAKRFLNCLGRGSRKARPEIERPEIQKCDQG